MDLLFYETYQQQRARDNSVSINSDENFFGPARQVMLQRNQSTLSSPSYIWNSSPAATQQQNPLMTFMPSASTKTLWSMVENGHQNSSRNLLMTTIPQECCAFITEMVKAHYQHSIHQVFSKHVLDTITMVIVFYGIDQAVQCYGKLTHLLKHTKEFRMADLVFCSSATVSSVFDIELAKLQNTHLSVSLSGALSNIGTFNYKEILESFGELHHLTEPELSSVSSTLLVEYKDTRTAVVAQKALHNSAKQGFVFNACLTKFEVEEKNARTIQRPLEQLRLAQENKNPFQHRLSSRHTSGPQLAPRFFPLQSDSGIYSVFGGIDNQKWIPSLSSPLAPLSAPPFLLPRSHGSYQQQHAANLVSSCPFILQPKNTNVPTLSSPIDWASFDSTIPPHYHRLQQHQQQLQQQHPTISDFGTSLSISDSDNDINTRQDKNVDQRHGPTLILPSVISHHHHHHQGLNMRQAELHTPTSYSSGSNTAIESYVQCSFGPPTPSSSSSLTNMDRQPSSTSTQPIVDGDINIGSEMADARDCHFDVDKVINRLDSRTTFMIRNIPNKYTQAMLMDSIDATHKKTYDFLYLRIDFKNKCNVGYAFINFINVDSVASFAERYVGKHWNRFNSGKVCELSYAKIQGRANLIDKFRNSIVMNHDASYRPKIFYSTGPRKGEEQEFPSPTAKHLSKSSK